MKRSEIVLKIPEGAALVGVRTYGDEVVVVCEWPESAPRRIGFQSPPPERVEVQE